MNTMRNILLCFCACLITRHSEASNESNGMLEVTSLDGYTEEFRGVMLPSIYPVLLRSLSRGQLNRVVFTPDGNNILAAPGGWTIRKGWQGRSDHIPDSYLYLWSTASGEIERRLRRSRLGNLRIPFLRRPARISGLSMSPDGSMALSASTDARLLLHDMETGGVLRRMKGHGTAGVSMAFSADGSRVATTSYRSSVKIWDVHSGTLVREIEAEPSLHGGLAMSSKGESVVWIGKGSWGGRSILHLADIETGEIVSSLDERYSLTAPEFHYNDRRVLFAERHVVKEWDIETGRITRTFYHPLRRHYHRIAGISLSPNESLFVSWASGSPLFLWDLDTGTLVGELDIPAQNAAFTADGKRILAHRRWQVHSFTIPDNLGPVRPAMDIVAEMNDSDIVPTSLTFSSNGKLLAAIVNERRFNKPNVVLWCTDSWERLKEFGVFHFSRHSPLHLTFSPDDKALVVSSYHASVHPSRGPTYILCAETGDILPISSESDWTGIRSHRKAVMPAAVYTNLRNPQIAFTANNRPVILGREGPYGPARLRELKTMKPLSDSVFDGFAFVYITPDLGHVLVVSNGHDRSVTLWDMSTGEAVKTFENVSGHRISVSPDSSRFMTYGSRSRDHALYAIHDRQKISPLPVGQGPAILLNNTQVLFAGNHHIMLWDVEADSEVYRFYAHGARIEGLAVSPCRELVASMDASGKLFVWRIPSEISGMELGLPE